MWQDVTQRTTYRLDTADQSLNMDLPCQNWGFWVRSGKMSVELTQCIEFIWIFIFFQGSALHSVNPLHKLIEVCCQQVRVICAECRGNWTEHYNTACSNTFSWVKWHFPHQKLRLLQAFIINSALFRNIILLQMCFWVFYVILWNVFYLEILCNAENCNFLDREHIIGKYHHV